MNIFESELGSLYKITTQNEYKYQIEFDIIAIEKLQHKRVNQIFKNGCFSKELDDAIKSNQY